MEQKQQDKITIIDFLEYEVSSSWYAQNVGWTWLQRIIGEYMAWKVNRKYKSYKKYLQNREELLSQINTE